MKSWLNDIHQTIGGNIARIYERPKQEQKRRTQNNNKIITKRVAGKEMNFSSISLSLPLILAWKSRRACVRKAYSRAINWRACVNRTCVYVHTINFSCFFFFFFIRHFFFLLLVELKCTLKMCLWLEFVKSKENEWNEIHENLRWANEHLH